MNKKSLWMRTEWVLPAWAGSHLGERDSSGDLRLFVLVRHIGTCHMDSFSLREETALVVVFLKAQASVDTEDGTVESLVWRLGRSSQTLALLPAKYGTCKLLPLSGRLWLTICKMNSLLLWALGVCSLLLVYPILPCVSLLSDVLLLTSAVPPCTTLW